VPHPVQPEHPGAGVGDGVGAGVGDGVGAGVGDGVGGAGVGAGVAADASWVKVASKPAPSNDPSEVNVTIITRVDPST